MQTSGKINSNSIGGLVQDRGIAKTMPMDIAQFCTKSDISSKDV